MSANDVSIRYCAFLHLRPYSITTKVVNKVVTIRMYSLMYIFSTDKRSAHPHHKHTADKDTLLNNSHTVVAVDMHHNNQ